MQALGEYGAKDILFLGTAGAINPEFKVGDWVDPETVKHTHVESPNLEAQVWLNEKTKAGVDIVDVEYAYAKVSAGKIPGMKFESRLLISDVLQGPNHADLHESTSIAKIDHLRENLKKLLIGKLSTLGLELDKVSNTSSLYFEFADPNAQLLGLQDIQEGIYNRQKVLSGRIHGQYLSAARKQTPYS